MRKIPFKVSARTAKLIGLENFSTEEGAIIELVKNAYDADAKNCILLFDIRCHEQNCNDLESNKSYAEVFDRRNSAIYIIDNGVGMTDSVIQNQWMTIGTNNKLYNQLSSGGRIKTGAKGIGRFALNRLGLYSEMVTLPSLKEVKNGACNLLFNEGFEWRVNWGDFDKDGATVSDIEAELIKHEFLSILDYLMDLFQDKAQVRETLSQISFNSGTILKISDLNDDWSEDKILKLCGSLENLLPPEGQSDFQIDLLEINNRQSLGRLKRAYYDDYDYKVKAVFNQDNNRLLKVYINRNELDVSALENAYSSIFSYESMRNEPYRLDDFKKDIVEIEIPIDHLISDTVDKRFLDRIGMFDFTFYFLKNSISDDREGDEEAKYPYIKFNSSARRAWLKKFGGVKIFRDDFRIRPYGEYGDDWLRLGERQAQSPGGAGQRLGGYKIRPNQIAGTIRISRVHNPFFQDKSGREGLIENEEFILFKNIIKEIIAIFERDRNIIMYNLSERYKIEKKDADKLREGKLEAQKVQEGSLSEKSQMTNSAKKLADAFLILEKENEKKDEEIRLLRSFASVGLIVSSFAHELNNLKTRLGTRAKFLEELLSIYIDKSLLKDKIIYENPLYHVDLIAQEDIKLQYWLKYSLTTLKRDKRERKNVDLNLYFNEFCSTWNSPLTDRKISLQYIDEPSGKAVLKAFEIDLDCIFNNLISNSMNALKGRIEEKKQIIITCRYSENMIIVIFSDNGKGLDAKYKDNPNLIFNLLESSKVDRHGNVIGTGLGLSIVQSIISEYNRSTINVIQQEKGLGFEIKFKIK